MRFLIVDDDTSIHMYLQSVLAPYGECECALGGKEGVAAFAKAMEAGTPYDVVLMDILMPDMGGLQAAKLMRDMEKENGVSRMDQFTLVMITSLVDDANVSTAFFDTEATCYVVKPLDKAEVIAELKQNLII